MKPPRWACLALLLATVGCVATPRAAPVAPVRIVHNAPGSPATAVLQPVRHEEPDEKEQEKPAGSDATALIAAPPQTAQPVPVALDTIFRLAEEQNPRVGLAREKVHEGCLDAELKAKEAHWPTLTAGLTYYRHEGGIQNENGTLTHSSTGALFPGLEIRAGLDLRQFAFAQVGGLRQQAQARAELTKITQEVLLDAASTYVDLLAARKAEAVVHEVERLQREMLVRAEKLAEEEPTAKILVQAARGDTTASQQMQVQFRQQGDAAAAKLAYLLGLGCEARPVPLDPDLLPLDLVDVSGPVEALVARVRETGPGVGEVHELLAAIQSGISQANSPAQFLPTVQVSAVEGAFAAGPGGTLDLDNRFDLCLAVKWNLTEYLTAQEKLRLARSKLCQVELTAQELKNKLALAVQEGRDTIYASRARFRLAAEQVQSLGELYRLSRLAVQENVAGTRITDVLNAVRSLQQAHLAHVQTVQAHNKAQVRLLLLLGR